MRPENHLAIIEKFLLQILRINYFSSLDSNIDYISMHPDQEAQIILTMTTLYSLYQCLVSPQGIKTATAIVQGRMISSFIDMK